MKSKVEKLVNDHWKYIKKVLELHGVPTREIDIIGVHYKTAMIHGYKHGKEDANE